MIPRVLTGILALWLIALASLGEAQTPATAPAKKQGAAAPIATTSTVYHREKGSKDWMLFGYYSSEESARQVFTHLAHTGYEVELRISNTPVPKMQPLARSAPLPTGETVTYGKAVEAFDTMNRQNDIAFKFPIDGCYARAQLMIERMNRMGFKPRKVWAVANGDSLQARTKNHPRGFVKWGYHVAPVLRVRNSEGGQRWYVIDPSLFSAPATVAQWMKAQMRDPKNGPRPFMTVTKVGEAPLWVDRKPKPGSGYWPGSDPSEGPHKHALAVMRKYKAWEGKTPPKNLGYRGAPERLGPGVPFPTFDEPAMLPGSRVLFRLAPGGDAFFHDRSQVDPQLLDHRPHRSRQEHALRPVAFENGRY